MTPERHVILAALIRKAAEIEVDLNLTGDEKPSALQLVLVRARETAIEACEKLIYADATDVKMIVSLQQDVQHFLDVVASTQVILQEAAQAERELIDDEEREAVRDLVLDRHTVTEETDGAE